jgi:hypothetical protein
MAMLVGYLLTEPLDYGTMGFFGLIVLMLVSPIIIKWHYPIMVFSLGCPIYLFFLVGRPPMLQVAVLMSLGFAIVERAMSRNRQFLSVPELTWPLVFLAGVFILTAELTGGIGLHSLGGSGGGGKKYIALGCGIATYFALTSRTIQPKQRNLYLILFFLAGSLSFISDLFPVLPGPLKAINLLIPPSGASDNGLAIGTTRLGAFAAAAACGVNFMLAKYGMRGIFMSGRPARPALMGVLLMLTMLGGFRTTLINFMTVMTVLFFIEGLQRTRLVMIFAFAGVLGAAVLVPFANKLPFTFQRTLSFLPLNIDPAAKVDAEVSAEWRYRMWHDLWPQVPQYLLLGKGYALTSEDFQEMGSNRQFNDAHFDASREPLAISGDYHNGPLSVVIPFGVWGCLGYLWFTLAGIHVTYRNFKYGLPELKTVNTLFFVFSLNGAFQFLFITGGLSTNLGGTAAMVGLSVALNGGVRRPQSRPAEAVRSKSLSQPQPQTA